MPWFYTAQLHSWYFRVVFRAMDPNLHKSQILVIWKINKSGRLDWNIQLNNTLTPRGWQWSVIYSCKIQNSKRRYASKWSSLMLVWMHFKKLHCQRGTSMSLKARIMNFPSCHKHEESFWIQVRLFNKPSSEETGCGGKQLATAACLAMKGQ